MQMVLLTAIGVGGATVIGAVLGFIFKSISHKFSDIVLGFAAGVMLCASVDGLILPSLEGGGIIAPVISIIGIFCGALVLNLIDRFVPCLHKLAGNVIKTKDTEAKTEHINKIMLFVLAIAIHNFPEGIAAGVGFGSGDISEALTIAGGIALQNIPEGMVIIAPMLSVGISKGKTFLIGVFTGMIEIIGTLIGYYAITVSTAILPFALAFAGGTMLYIIGDEMIPETHAHGNARSATYALLSGFCLMLVVSFYL